jgi:hypothetical protein
MPFMVWLRKPKTLLFNVVNQFLQTHYPIEKYFRCGLTNNSCKNSCVYE